MLNGHPLVVNDVANDVHTADFAEQYQAIRIRAFVDAPFVSDRGIHFVIALHRDQPHQWYPDEIELLQQLANRIWASLERDRALTQLQIVETRLQDMLGSIQENFLAWDQDWNIAYLNAKAAETIGQPRQALVGQNFWELFPDVVGTTFWEQLHQVRRDRTPIQSEFYYPTWGRWYENRIYPTSEGIVNVSVDITQ